MLDTILQFVMAAGLVAGAYFLITGAQAFRFTKPSIGIIMIICGVLCMLGGGLLLCYTISGIIANNMPLCPECESNIGSNGYKFCPWCGMELKG